MPVSTPDRRFVVQGIAGLAAAAATPVRAQARSRSFMAIGDWGRDGGARQVEVATAMARTAQEVDSRFVLSVGDNFYPAGVGSPQDPQWRSSFEAIYHQPALQTPWYVALGNHDHRGSADAQVAYSKQSPRWRMPSRHFQVRGDELGVPELDLFVLDTSPMLPWHGEITAQLVRGRFPKVSSEAQLHWFEDALARSRAPWKVVVGHHPIHTGGSHGEPEALVEQVKPLLETYGVQVYLSGHDHILQHVRRGKVDYVVAGAGAEGGHVRRVEGTRFKYGNPGFAVFSVSGDVMALEFRDDAGRPLYRAALPRERA